MTGMEELIRNEAVTKVMKQQCIYNLVCGYRYCLAEILRRVCKDMRVVTVINTSSCHQMYG